MAEVEGSRGTLLLRFAAMLFVASAIEAMALHLLLGEVGPLAARALSIFAVQVATIALLPRLDLTARDSISVGPVAIIALLLISALVNYGLYAALLLTIPALQPLAALVLATAASMFFSFFGYSRFVFRSE
ncbi:GtrA family protein [Rhizobium sp. OAE497]|uniref:GtrA family protein n=1 Tax=Rhizobium sp. OAE497 TaxID=2663796 RepID=UPI001A300C3A